MFSRLPILPCILLLTGGGLSASAFSLLGPFDPGEGFPYQVPENYYNRADSVYGADIGGPQNLGEEYRWNVPTIFYGYDSTFLDFFGQQGVQAIENAISIFNALPRVSDLSLELNEYPLEAQKLNHRAAALGMVDLKSAAMTAVLEELGLVHSERFVWTLRLRQLPPGAECPFYEYRVVKRSFDPVSWMPTSYVNGVLYTYLILVSCNPEWSDARELPVDPTAITHTSVSAGPGWGLRVGGYFTGLTRDDVGGLRYLYRANNYNVEAPPPGSQVGGGVVGGGGGGSGPWTPINPPTTNVVDPGTPGDPGDPGEPAAPPTALRPGLERLRFVRVNYDSVLGNTFPAFTNAYSSSFVTNNRVVVQTVRRPVLAPDIVFSAADLLDGIYTRSAPNYIQSDPPVGGADVNGPGVLPPGVNVTFNKIGPNFAQVGLPFIGEDTAVPNFIWGSFDGSTNEPVVYPFHLSIKDLERQVLRR